MKHTVLARSYPGVMQRYNSSGGITRVTINTPAELCGSARLIEEAGGVDLDLFANAYRQGVERAKELCRQVFAGPQQRATGNLP